MCRLDTFIFFHWSWQTCVMLIGMTRIYRWPSRPRRRIPVLLHQTCCFVQMTCAQWRFIGMWSSIIRNTGGWRSLSQTVTYQEITHCGIWWPSTQILQISLSHSASATNPSILTANQLVSFYNHFCVIHQSAFKLLSHSTGAINTPWNFFGGLSALPVDVIASIMVTGIILSITAF